jgi:hypothetical protein
LLTDIYCHLMSCVNTTCCCVARRCVHVRKIDASGRVQRRVDGMRFATRGAAKFTHRIHASNH